MQDLVYLLKEYLEQSKEREETARKEGDPLQLDFEKGVTMGIYMCLSFTRQRAELLSIPLDEITLDSYPLKSK